MSDIYIKTIIEETQKFFKWNIYLKYQLMTVIMM